MLGSCDGCRRLTSRPQQESLHVALRCTSEQPICGLQAIIWVIGLRYQSGTARAACSQRWQLFGYGLSAPSTGNVVRMCLQQSRRSHMVPLCLWGEAEGQKVMTAVMTPRQTRRDSGGALSCGPCAICGWTGPHASETMRLETAACRQRTVI